MNTKEAIRYLSREIRKMEIRALAFGDRPEIRQRKETLRRNLEMIRNLNKKRYCIRKAN